ncbi:MAG: ATP-binding protein [Candidatus Latescibacterota bacterium]
MDDDEDDFVIVRDLLATVEHTRFRVDWVEQYDVALEQMCRDSHDVYLVDYRLGECDGVELLREALRHGCGSPVILLTGHGNYAIDLEAMRSGAADYLVKDDLEPALLERSIRHAVERVQLMRALSRQAEELARSNRLLEEKDRLLSVFHDVGQAALVSLELDEVLDNLAAQIIRAGIFPCLAIALVDPRQERVEVVRVLTREGDTEPSASIRAVGLQHALQADNLIARAAREGRMQVAEGGGEDPGFWFDLPERCRTRVTCFIPVKQADRVLAVLATSSRREEWHRTLRRIEVMYPLLDQVAAALDHAEKARQLKEAQAHLIQAEKMASLGQLVAGIAHEINNPVSFIMSSTQSLGEYVATFKALLGQYEVLLGCLENGSSARGQEVLERIARIRAEENVPLLLADLDQLLADCTEGLQRVSGIVQGLKNFARLDGGKQEEADVNLEIEEALKISWNELKYRCDVHRKLRPLPPLRCCPKQLSQVFVNLLVNAAQAIPEWGEVTVETWTTPSHLHVRVADTGTGIPSDIIHRIFDPFFTTKPTGKGTGLGLAVSYKIIEAHGGRVHVSSKEGEGTEFVIDLPSSDRGQG